MLQMPSTWSLWLGLLLLQGVVTTHEVRAPMFSQDATWWAGKRFGPIKPKASAPPKPSATPPVTGTSGRASSEGSKKPTGASPRGAAPSYTVGESDGGPGQWEKAPVRSKGSGYQRHITGAPEGVEYAVPAPTKSGKVLFDGYRNGKLLDAKDWEEWPPVNKKFWQEGVLADARKQIDAAKGTPIEWHFPSEDKASAVLELFQSRGIREIEVKISQKARP